MKSWKSKKAFKELFLEKAEVLFGKAPRALNKQEVYRILVSMVQDLAADDWTKTVNTYDEKKVRQVYYFSIEFLLGRLLNVNLLNCEAETICRNALKDLGFNLDQILPEEEDPGLGNGGLGRLAACFLDSLAALQLRCV